MEREFHTMATQDPVMIDPVNESCKNCSAVMCGGYITTLGGAILVTGMILMAISFPINHDKDEEFLRGIIGSLLLVIGLPVLCFGSWLYCSDRCRRRRRRHEAPSVVAYRVPPTHGVSADRLGRYGPYHTRSGAGDVRYTMDGATVHSTTVIETVGEEIMAPYSPYHGSYQGSRNSLLHTPPYHGSPYLARRTDSYHDSPQHSPHRGGRPGSPFRHTQFHASPVNGSPRHSPYSRRTDSLSQPYIERRDSGDQAAAVSSPRYPSSPHVDRQIIYQDSPPRYGAVAASCQESNQRFGDYVVRRERDGAARDSPRPVSSGSPGEENNLPPPPSYESVINDDS
ncbi:PREDICTED: uncharacterized protein LOC109481893 [Branchiostoma belcheri]|uniref:Uncharacterized protein LOC109481893 n=1 Tax=Branchiostoma belcheri TaxID=7741 RepID=A0A6P5A9T0_BRABE|nr:PREDICTED: uncharacterized protein LOC109481893 [Branchiostoma belcheri]